MSGTVAVGQKQLFVKEPDTVQPPRRPGNNLMTRAEINEPYEDRLRLLALQPQLPFHR